jgi:MFS family permease
MRTVLTWLTLLAWALWLGGLVTLFITVSSLFVTFADHPEVAGAAASAIFARFNVYQLIVAMVALFGGLLIPRAGRQKTFYIALVTVALALAVFVTSYLAPHLEAMREQGEVAVHSDAFKSMHGLSMLLYLTEVLLLVPAGILLLAHHEKR